MRRKTKEKMNYIISYIKKNYIADMLNKEFVDGYIERFIDGGESNMKKVQLKTFGANGCKELSRLLARMYKENILNRVAYGLVHPPTADSWPKWTYVYMLKHADIEEFELEGVCQSK